MKEVNMELLTLLVKSFKYNQNELTTLTLVSCANRNKYITAITNVVLFDGVTNVVDLPFSMEVDKLADLSDHEFIVIKNAVSSVREEFKRLTSLDIERPSNGMFGEETIDPAYGLYPHEFNTLCNKVRDELLGGILTLR